MHAEPSPAVPAPPRKNLLLGALSEPDYRDVVPHLERMALPLGLALYESGSSMDYVLFPTEGIVSLLAVMSSGATAEIALTGREGVVGTSLFMAGGNTPSRAIVQSAGNAYVLRESALKEHLRRRTELKQLLLRYAHELIMQAARSAMCNRYHTLDQQLCRWLLSSVDRLAGGEFQTTEELIGDILSVDREELSKAAGGLQEAGLIRYQRGHITVLDRPRIEQRSCECYAVLKRELACLRPSQAPS